MSAPPSLERLLSEITEELEGYAVFKLERHRFEVTLTDPSINRGKPLRIAEFKSRRAAEDYLFDLLEPITEPHDP